MNLFFRLLRTLSMLLFAAFGSVAAFAAPGDWSQIGYSIEAQDLDPQPVNLTNTARAPPTAGAYVMATGTAFARPGNLRASGGGEATGTTFALLRSSIATNTGAGGFYDPRAWRQNYDDFYDGNVTSTTVPPFSAPNARLAGQAHPRTDIVFDQRGFPIFDDVTRYDTRFPASAFNATDYAGQMRMATRDLRTTMADNPQLRSQFTRPQLDAIQGGRAKIPDFTWHHHQDSGRMQLVPSTTHRRTGHIGGEAMSGGQ